MDASGTDIPCHDLDRAGVLTIIWQVERCPWSGAEELSGYLWLTLPFHPTLEALLFGLCGLFRGRWHGQDLRYDDDVIDHTQASPRVGARHTRTGTC
jgi:hypothetical protein